MTNLFTNISEKNQEKILKILEASTLNFKPNCQILTSVKLDNMIGIVISGYMQIIRTDYNGNRTIIEELTENDVFGTTISSLTNECEIITKEDTKIVIIDFNNILNDVENNLSYYKQFIKNLLEIYSDKINTKNERIEILTKKTIRDKLLEYFKIVSKRNNSKKIYLTMTYIELADYLAVDRSAMTRELKNLTDEGFIDRVDKKITLLY
jgi:CRP-like cAMP-binding protein